MVYKEDKWKEENNGGSSFFKENGRVYWGIWP